MRRGGGWGCGIRGRTGLSAGLGGGRGGGGRGGIRRGGWRGGGVWNRGAYAFVGGFAGRPGKGGPDDDPTGYIAPTRQEILDWSIRHEYGYALIVGDLKGIREYVYAHAKRPGPPEWRFETDRQGWTYQNARDAGWPIEGALRVRPAEGERASLVGPAGF